MKVKLKESHKYKIEVTLNPTQAEYLMDLLNITPSDADNPVQEFYTELYFALAELVEHDNTYIESGAIKYHGSLTRH